MLYAYAYEGFGVTAAHPNQGRHTAPFLCTAGTSTCQLEIRSTWVPGGYVDQIQATKDATYNTWGMFRFPLGTLLAMLVSLACSRTAD